ncbi:hypothetical protein VTK26DRAFT_2893 [Humicola hyalothermophila]
MRASEEKSCSQISKRPPRGRQAEGHEESHQRNGVRPTKHTEAHDSRGALNCPATGLSISILRRLGREPKPSKLIIISTRECCLILTSHIHAPSLDSQTPKTCIKLGNDTTQRNLR